MHKLIIEDDEGKTTIVPLIRDEITIGRKEGNTIRLTERNVSRRHAKLTKQNGQVFLEDLGSYNGIKVNGNKIKGRVALQEGDRVQIGDYLLAMKMEGAQARKADPFDEMKTIPIERAQAAQLAEGAAAPPAAPPGQPPPQPAAQPTQPPPQPATPPKPAARPAQEEAPAPPIREDLVDGAQDSLPARLVVTSQNLGGTEFALDKPSCVIGRIPENDIVVEHRSISRHHAKIVQEGGSYFVVDLESQNGVIVNGERYDRVQLRKGDNIDLGHVRLRFVAPGENYVYAEHKASPWSGDKKPRTGVYLAAGGLVAVAALAVVLLWPKPKKKPDEKKAAEKTTKTTTGPSSPSMEQPRVVSLDRSKINAAIAARDWDKAIEECDAFLKVHPGDSGTLILKNKAIVEKNNLKRYERFMQAWKKGRLETALEDGNNFPEKSVYYTEVKGVLPKVQERYASDKYTRAQTLFRRKKCKELRQLSIRMGRVVPKDRRFTYLSDRCGKAHVAVEDPRPRRTRKGRQPGRATPTPRPTPRPSPSGGPTATQLANQTRAAWASNNCSKAIRVGKKAYRAKSSSRVAMMVGTCACRTKRKSAAKWAFRRLSGGFKAMVARACKAKGIPLP